MSEDLRNYINSLRHDFMQQSLSEESCDPDPFCQFSRWLEEAIHAQILDPHAMVLATAGKDLQPSCRTVYLRDFNGRGFVFYTNYNSLKGRQLDENPRAALLFLWEELERQVRVEGRVEKITPEQSDAYFASRPRESQLAAWASEQSAMIGSRQELEQKFYAMQKKFEGGQVPRPSHWGGYILLPSLFEFWQGRPNRMHDRIAYRWLSDGWQKYRLSP